MNKPFLEIKSDSFRLSGFELQPLDGFEFPKNKKGGEFPNCCKFHTEVFREAEKWFDRFPNCCEPHKELASKIWFDKTIYKGIELKIVKQVVYTEHTIKLKIDSVDWFEAITEYIEAGVFAFGMPAIGQHHYLTALKNYLSGWTATKLPPEKCKSLIQFIDDTYYKPEKNDFDKETDLNILYATYTKWLAIFPFEISFFGELKSGFEKTIPFVNGELKRNRYTGVSTGKLHTKTTLIWELIKLTNALLSKINVLTLYRSGKLTETKKLQLELIIASRAHKVNKIGYANTTSNEERRFRKMIREWFEDEKRFINELIPIIGNMDAPIKEPDLLINGFREFGFFELPKVKELTPNKLKTLINLIKENSVPYKIAMLDYLGFIEHIDKKHIRVKDKRNKEISKWFNIGTDGRIVKGNINSLQLRTNENLQRYTAHQYKETVEKAYQNLK